MRQPLLPLSGMETIQDMLKLTLKKAYPECTAMFWAGCGADQNPLPRRKLELAQKYRAELAQAVNDVLASPMAFVEPELSSKYVETQLELQGVPDQQQLSQTVKSTNPL